MIINRKISLIVLLTTISSLSIYGQRVSIIDSLKVPDINNQATVIVHQDKAITEMINNHITGYQDVPRLERGWCVQVFSDNSIGAMEEAFKIENEIKEKIPYEYVRSERHSPFWKVRVGQFETMEEAQTLRELLIEEFPDLKGGIYIVRFSNK